MPDKFDPYREALVMETETHWPEPLVGCPPAERTRLAEALHANPEAASQLEYIRTHTGFCRPYHRHRRRRPTIKIMDDRAMDHGRWTMDNKTVDLGPSSYRPLSIVPSHRKGPIVSQNAHSMRVALGDRSYDIETGSGNLSGFSSIPPRPM